MKKSLKAEKGLIESAGRVVLPHAQHSHNTFRLFMNILIGSLTLSLLLLPKLALAQILPACTATGNCGICDFLDTFVNIIRWVLGIVGGTALFLMVWHGFGWLTAAGNKERIESTRKALMHTVIGILIILVAWQLVNIVIVLLVNPHGGASQALIFKDTQKIWYEYCTGTGDEQCVGRGNGSPCGNGSYCYNQKCASVGQEITEIVKGEVKKRSPRSACDYWATHPAQTMGGFNPYAEYTCIDESKCDPYENLGTAYCKQDKPNKQSCCQAKPE